MSGIIADSPGAPALVGPETAGSELGQPEAADDNRKSPLEFAIDGFNGPLDRLLALARTQQIDLGRLSFVTLVDQLAEALLQPSTTALSEKGDWVVTAAWLVHLRSLLLLPAQTPARQQAETEAQQLRQHLVERQQTQALAAWLADRPQLGYDVFAVGKPAISGTWVEVPAGSDPRPLDIIEFLWASLMLFDDDLPDAETTARYRPPWQTLYRVPQARERILRLLAAIPSERLLESLLPPIPDTPQSAVLWRRSAWSSMLVAGLELEKQGVALLRQDRAFLPIRIAPRSSADGQADSEAASAH